MGRKGLNDAIHGDRAAIRGYTPKKELGWEEWAASKDDKPKEFNSSYVRGGYSSKSSKGGDSYKFSDIGPRCYETHPALKLPGADPVIYGGSCYTPIVKDADVYIGFDAGMALTKRVWPWTPGDEVRFKVPDMGVPEHVRDYHKLVDWTKAQLEAGRKVHCGCIGGHGRTGMFLAALVSRFGEKDAITYVRKHYCKKAVESSAQVKFLGKEFGITAAEGYKSYSSSKDVVVHSPKTPHGSGSSPKSGNAAERFTPVGGSGCIWG